MFYGNPRQLGVQFLAALMTTVFSMAVTAVLLIVLKATLGIRVSALKERLGLDETLHQQVPLPPFVFFLSPFLSPTIPLPVPRHIPPCHESPFIPSPSISSQVWQPVMRPLALRRGSSDVECSMTHEEVSYASRLRALALQQGWATDA